jgi:hypothetical protein
MVLSMVRISTRMLILNGREDSEDTPMRQVAMAEDEVSTTSEIKIAQTAMSMIDEWLTTTSLLEEALFDVLHRAKPVKILSMSVVRNSRHLHSTEMPLLELLVEIRCRITREWSLSL